MNDAALVDVGDSLDERGKELAHFAQWERAALQATGQRATFDIGRHKEESPLLLAEFEEREDMFMLEVRADFGLTQKALAGRDVVDEIRADDFNSYLTPKS